MADDVQVKMCLQEIVKLEMSINAVIQDVRECEGPLEELQDLNQAVRERINELKGRLEELEQLAEEQDKETDKLAILRDVDSHKKQLASTQGVLRKANLACQLSIEKRDRESLIDSSANQAVRHRGSSDKQQLAKTSGKITQDLMSLNRTLAEQVMRGEQTMNTLVTSSQQVSDTQEEFKSMSGHITNSRKLLTKFGRREFTDKLLIFMAVLFFLSSAAYIFKKRFLDRIWSSS